METQSYLIFSLQEFPFGIAAPHVREIFQLPELTSIADAPGDIIGILNLRGQILPVMHLAKRLGQPVQACSLSDSVIVVDWQGLQVGVVVNQVEDVYAFEAAAIESEPVYGRSTPVNTTFVAGVAKEEDRLITLLNPETLIRDTEEVALMVWEAKLNSLDSESTPNSEEISLKGHADPLVDQAVAPETHSALTNFFDLYCPGITPAEQLIFRQRAIALRPSLETTDDSELLSLAVVGLGEEYFGLALKEVREFINIGTITPIPCCPPHIVGNINLRGEVMTLVDIRKALNLAKGDNHLDKAIVIEVDDVIAGITVDEVVDVMDLPTSEMTALPTAVPKQYQAFFQGTTLYHQKPLSILDLSKLLSQGGLIVDQAA